MKKDSKQWKTTCPSCGYVGNLWKHGHMLAKNAKQFKAYPCTCAKCGKRKYQRMDFE